MSVSTQTASGYAGSTNTANAGPNLKYSQGGGKTASAKAMNSVVQVDPSNMLDLFKTGVAAQNEYYQKGLQYYSDSVAMAAQQIQAAYGASNATLTPLSVASQQALNEQMRMLGMQPVSMTSGYANRLGTLGMDNTDTLQSLQDKMVAAESITDPTARAAEKQAVLEQLKGLNNSFNTDTEISNLSKPNRDEIGIQALMAGNTGMPRDMAEAMWYSGDKRLRIVNDANKSADSTYASQQADYEAKVAELKNQGLLVDAQNQGLQSLYNDYNQYYGTDSQKPYTGEEVSQKLTSTPGYQYRLASGTDAIARRGAAVGMLDSGNTMASLLEYGQGLASNTFNTYMNNLSNISGLGAQATVGISNNQTGLGTAQGNLSTALGTAQNATNQAMGSAINQSNQAQAGLLSQIAQFNASMQYNSKQANLNRQQSAQTAGLSSAAGIMNAGTNAAAFSNSVYNQQQQANSFANQMGGFRPSGYWQV